MNKPRKKISREFSSREIARSLLDQLLTDSRLYKDSESYKELLSFTARLRNVAPFNAMLLQIQKPGITYVASAYDWWTRFRRRPKEIARPLLILWPFAPVATVYDVQDTEGDVLPEDAFSFPVSGQITATKMQSFVRRLNRKNINCVWVDSGDASAGSICSVRTERDNIQMYRLNINRNHEPAVQFSTLAHELAHLFLGHLGPDKKLNVRERRSMTYAEEELEAESAAYIVCERHGVKLKSESYLSQFVGTYTSIENIDIYQVTHAAGQIESVLRLTAHTRFNKPKGTKGIS